MYSYINLKCVGGGQYVYNSAEIHLISNMNISLSMKIVISLMKEVISLMKLLFEKQSHKIK